MQIVKKPVEMICWFDNKGDVTPIRFRIEDENGMLTTIKIRSCHLVEIEKFAGNIMKRFMCTAAFGDLEKPFEVKFEVDSGKWILFKI